MSQCLRFLLDTNILIPLQDSMLALEPSLASFVRLAGVGGHQLLYHPASETDIDRDNDIFHVLVIEDKEIHAKARQTHYQRPMLGGASGSPTLRSIL